MTMPAVEISSPSSAWPLGMPAVGQRARRSRTVQPEDIELFTRISGDRNPLHYDAELARSSRFGEIIVQGGITTAILNAVVAEDLPGPGTVFLQVEWAFGPSAPATPSPARSRSSRCAPTSRSPGCAPA